MKDIKILDIGKYNGEEVRIRGWLYNKRSKGKITFLIIRDGTGYIQCVVSKDGVTEEVFDAAKIIGQESSIEVIGAVREDKRAKSGYEISVKEIQIISLSKQYPLAIAENRPNIDKLMDIRHLWMRSQKPSAILKIRHEIVQALRDYLYKEDFINVDSPLFQPVAVEGTSTLFGFPYFDLGESYLSQSGQRRSLQLSGPRGGSRSRPLFCCLSIGQSWRRSRA